MSKILVIDDDPDIVETLRMRLTANTYQVVVAFDGEQGLLTAINENPDLIILDVLMPKMDGYSFLRELKTIKSIKDTPIIMLTAKDMMKDLFEVEGVKDYLVKPFAAEDLLKKIKNIINENG